MTNQQQNGKEESITLSRLQKFEEELDDFITGVGLGNLTYESEADKAMSLTIDQLKGLSADDCGNLSYKLQQYATFIQQRYNRAKNMERWAKHNMNIVVAKEGNAYGSKYTKYEEKYWMVAAGNTYAKSLNNIILQAGAKMSELDSMSSKIHSMAQALREIQQNKRWNK